MTLIHDKLSRRTVLAGLAALPVVPALVPEAQGATSIGITEPITSVAAAPTENPFRWWARFRQAPSDYFDDFWDMSFDTREEAEAEVLALGGGQIMEAMNGDYSIEVDGSQILEILDGQNEGNSYEDDYFSQDVTDAQAQDLGEMVSAAISAWVKKHGISTQSRLLISRHKENVFPLIVADAEAAR